MRYYSQKGGQGDYEIKDAIVTSKKRYNDKLGSRDIGVKEIGPPNHEFFKKKPSDDPAREGNGAYNDVVFTE